jgi:hypothetical protein
VLSIKSKYCSQLINYVLSQCFLTSWSWALAFGSKKICVMVCQTVFDSVLCVANDQTLKTTYFKEELPDFFGGLQFGNVCDL